MKRRKMKKEHSPMKNYSGRVLTAILPALLLFCLFPPTAAAQEGPELRREERVEKGRFGAEDEEASPSAGDENHYDKWLYLGGRIGPSLRFYTPAGDTPHTGGDTSSFSLEAAFQATLQLNSFLSVQGEAVFTWDKASVWAYHRPGGGSVVERYTWDFTGFSLQLPLLVKLNFYPGDFRVSPFFGAYYLAPLGRLKAVNSLTDDSQSSSYDFSPPIGLTAGLAGAMKMGPGSIFADLRYSADLGEPDVRDGDLATYKRAMLSLTIGFEWAFFDKNKEEQP
jgi:hypothetical protein